MLVALFDQLNAIPQLIAVIAELNDKGYAVPKYPHSMGAWSQASRSHVAHMKGGDFYFSEKSLTVENVSQVRAVANKPTTERSMTHSGGNLKQQP